MPFGWAAGALAVGTIASSAISAGAAGDAANAQEQASQNANATQLQMYNTTRQDQAPWRQAGGQAINALSQWYGLGGVSTPTSSSSSVPQGYDPSTGTTIGAGGRIGQLIPGGTAATPATPTQSTSQPPDYNAILSNLPGYQFQKQQGNEAVQRNLAAAGLLQSGAAGKALDQYGQGLASNYATQYVNGLQSLAGLGQTSVANTGVLGANTANQIGSNQIYAGNAQASGYVGQANAINSGLSGLTGFAGQAPQLYQQYLQSQYSPAATNLISQQGTDYIGANMDYSVAGLP